MTASISETIKKIADSETAKIDIPTKNNQTIRLDCIYKESISPNFFLVFPPKKLPEAIDLEKHCPVSIKHGQTSLTVTAKITAINGDRTLELTAKNSVRPESLREYFRVGANVSITARYDPESMESKIPSWNMDGHTLDMSGSGVLAIFPEDPKSRHKISLQIHLAGNRNPVHCIGHVVRSRRLRRDSYQVAFHFDSINAKDKDSIISYCLREQRNQLRKKVQTAG
ncbi:putative glycosyltransferase [Desulfocapsa sulfexigens DSM 10523]|uniref:Putative glycosyltransferase n=1 Tax=Desulfocapsa sulfexigens (strain DSM 10523 / SB164P1) TaxID=1167006 RepID=M1PDI1_DESSD|nr:PilZ domain-containing protein [Desulfocapsa sulfexigens]AGF79652.1 putative glycosyltransferase [Desulfocapsa sulfexigens DSM 10523]